MDEKTKATGGELFIVDNSDTEWKGLRYLHDWTEIATRFDIATGYFEIGALLALDGKWQKLEKIRILMGDETTQRTKKAIAQAVQKQVEDRLDSSIEDEKEKNDFLAGVPAIVAALKSGQIECRVYSQKKFHAKAYITHPRVQVIGSVALVGSSNFTLPGLTQNVELNIQIRAPGDVSQLQAWFDQHWELAEEVTPEIISVIARHVHAYTPFEVYAKALYELFQSHELSDSEWEKADSKMYRILDQYQKEGYHSILKISRQHNGALLCDGVGLGKTFVGLMLIERLVMRDKKRVLLLVPKSGRIAVWERTIQRFMPHLLNGFLPFKIYNHTDLTRKGSADGRDYPAEFEQMKEQADVVIIDEAHHFRNRGLSRKSGGSRYWRLFDIIDTKTVFLLTATPINNHLTDFQHLIELFSREKPDAFSGSLGIHSVPAHFQRMEKALRKATMPDLKDESEIEVDQVEAGRVLLDDKLFRELVVQRSRKYAQESQKQHGGREAIFPEKAPPKVAEYSVKKTYGHLLKKVEDAFSKPAQLFSLAVYYPLAYWRGDKKPEAFDVNRQQQVVRLIRIQFLKRFESSIYAFEASCQNLLVKLLGFMEKNVESTKEVRRLERWKLQNDELLRHVMQRRAELQEEDQSEEVDTSEIGEEFRDFFEVLKREEYDVEGIFDDTYADLEQLVDFLEELKTFTPEHDNKLQSLIKLLKTDPVLKEHKCLIFSEFMATARYLRRELEKAGIHGVDEIDSGSKVERGEAIQRFAPYYNGTTSVELKKAGVKEARILISTDVLSEGLNLQDATRLINYDLHWNPVRLMQRIGRVDRRLDPVVEKRLLADHPEQKALRGRVAYWNFLPPEDLEDLLRLYQRVSHKTLRISKVFGIEGKKLLTEKDDFDALRDFTHTYEGTMSPVEELHLEYQKMIADDPDLEGRLERLPGRVFSGKAAPAKVRKGVFLCYALPAEDKTLPPEASDHERWEKGATRTGWYFYGKDVEAIVEQPETIAPSIRSDPETRRKVVWPEVELREIRLKVEKHIKNTYLKQVQAPVGIGPVLKCWMEVN